MISKSGGAVISERKNAKDRRGDCLTLSGFGLGKLNLMLLEIEVTNVI